MSDIPRPFVPGTRMSRLDRQRAARLRPVPGSVYDPKQGRHRFDRWDALPAKAWQLYWRTHPQAWAKAQELRGF